MTTVTYRNEEIRIVAAWDNTYQWCTEDASSSSRESVDPSGKSVFPSPYGFASEEAAVAAAKRHIDAAEQRMASSNY